MASNIRTLSAVAIARIRRGVSIIVNAIVWGVAFVGSAVIFYGPFVLVIVILIIAPEKRLGLISTYFLILGLLLLVLVVATLAKPYWSRPTSIVVKELDLSRLEQSLIGLLSAYKDALRLVDQLPRVGLTKTYMKEFDASTVDPRWLRPFWGGGLPGETWLQSKQLVVKPLVRLHVESHIRRRLLEIMTRLRYESLAIKDSDSAVNRLEILQSRLRDIETTLFGWSRLRKLLTKVPLLPVFAGTTAVLAALRGFEEPSAEALSKSYLYQLKTHSWNSLTHEVAGYVLIAVSALYLLYLLTVPIVAQGFNAKKALFSGGQLSSAENNLFGAKSYQVVWEEFPRCKVYEAEDNVFDVLHIKKPPELQADIVFAAVPYFACSTAAMAEVFVFYFTPDWPIVILAQIPLLAFVLLVMDQRRISQRRRLEGHA